MPQAVVAFFYWAGTAIGTTLAYVGVTSVALNAALVNIGLRLIQLTMLNWIYDTFFGPEQGGTPSHSFTVTTRSTMEHQRIVYGETICSGPIWFMNATGSQNQALHMGIVVAGHEIEDMTDMWIDDHVIPNEYIQWVGTGAVTSGDFRGDVTKQECLYFDKFRGTTGQHVSPDLVDLFTEITSDHQGRGQAWFLARLDYFEGQTQVWSAGQPGSIKATVLGKKVYDPRSDSSQPFGNGPHALANSLTWEWSDNPALIWADYMIDSRLGFGENYNRINYSYVASAANICDEIVYTPVGTDKRFRCNGTLSAGDTYRENIRRILSSMNGEAPLINGEWKVRAWGYNTPTLQFDEDVLQGDLSIRLDPDDKQRFNSVRANFIDKDRLWKSSQAPEFTSSEYISRDNDVKLYKDLSLHMTKDVYMAQRLMAGALEQSDLEVVCILPTNYKTLPVEVGDTIALSVDKMNWTNKEFTVQNYKLQDMGGIDLIVKETNANAFTDVGTDEYTVSSGGGYVYSTSLVPSPSDLTAEARLEGVSLKATPPAGRLYDYLRFSASSINSLGSAIEIGRVRGDSYTFNVSTTAAQYFWVRAENYLGSISSYFPNSGMTGVIARVSSAVGLVFSESSAETTLSSDWTSAAKLASVGINPGGDFNFRADVTVETMLYQKAAMENTDASMRVRHAVGAPTGWTTLGVIRDTTVGSVQADWHSLKRTLQSNVNTDHYFAVEAIANYSQSSEWIANSYSNITAKLVPQARANLSKVKKDAIQIFDNATADRIAADTGGSLTVTANDVSETRYSNAGEGRVPQIGYKFTSTNVTGGTPPYTYAWNRMTDAEGIPFVISDSGTQNPGWYGALRADGSADDLETWKVTVTDSGSLNTGNDTINVTLTFVTSGTPL